MADDCIETTYCRTDKGYGQVRIKGKLYRHHRIVYAAAKGVTVESLGTLMVLHTCDNPSCVNPSHLWLGTAADNTADMLKKGRAAGPSNQKGEQNPAAKLTPEAVLDIRRGILRQVDYAARYGITQALVSLVQLNKVWQHVK